MTRMPEIQEVLDKLDLMVIEVRDLSKKLERLLPVNFADGHSSPVMAIGRLIKEKT